VSGDLPVTYGDGTDFFVINIGTRPRGGTLVVTTCGTGSAFDSMLLLGNCSGESGPFMCAAASDDACGIDAQAVLSPAIGQYFQVGIAAFGNASGGTYSFDWSYTDPVTPSGTPSGTSTPNQTVTGTSTPSQTPTGSGTAAVTHTRTGTASRTPALTPSSTRTGTPPTFSVPTCVDSTTGAPFPFKSVLVGTSGVTPVHVNNASNATRVFNCPGVTEAPWVPTWLETPESTAPADYHVLDMGPDAPLFGNLTLDTCGLGSELNSFIWVRTACPNSVSYECIAQNDNGRCGGGLSNVTFPVPARFLFVAVSSSSNETLSGSEWSQSAICLLMKAHSLTLLLFL